jgi:hypothetical protein
MSAFFLTGDFNDWDPGSHPFSEVTSPYGRDEWGREHPQRLLGSGAYRQIVDLVAGKQRFKILEGVGWERQWSAMPYHEEEIPFGRFRFSLPSGLSPGVIVPRGSGSPPHAEVELPGGPVCFDFHPDSRTLSVHQEPALPPGPRVSEWREFPCGPDALYRTWVALPYGWSSGPCALCLVFDGRSLIYGEDLERDLFGLAPRQLPRAWDLLNRQSLVPPTILVGVEVPRRPAEPTEREAIGRHDRREAFVKAGGALHEAYRQSLVHDLLPALAQEHGQELAPDSTYALGHSWGADFALRLLAGAPEAFAGAIALSPARPREAVTRLAERLRVAILYGRDDLGPFFLTEAAECRRLLAERGLDHLVQLCPTANHDPETLADYLPAALSFVVRG